MPPDKAITPPCDPSDVPTAYRRYKSLTLQMLLARQVYPSPLPVSSLSCHSTQTAIIPYFWPEASG